VTLPYCSACGTVVPDLETNHHVCVPDGKGGWTKTTRDLAAAAEVRATAQTIPVSEAFTMNASDAAAAAQLVPAPAPAPVVGP
jgi:hypothetical protein